MYVVWVDQQHLMYYTFYTVPDTACVFFGGDILVSTEGDYDPDNDSCVFQIDSDYDDCALSNLGFE